MKHYSVLIVGAGPVGMALAAELYRYEIDFLIIDKRPSYVTTSNAAGIHARTLECWHGRPWLTSMLRKGLLIKDVFIKSKKSCLAKLPFDQLSHTQYPFILSLPQNDTEEILANYLIDVDCAVKRETQLIDFFEEKDQIVARIKSLQEEEQITANYLIGCDGYHSSVRNCANISYLGTDIKDRFFLIDAKLKAPMKKEFQIYLHPKGILAFFIMPHSVRVVAAVGHDSQYKDVSGPNLEIMNQIIKQRASLDYEITEVLWQSHFWIHEKIAANFKQNKVFLLGDAAHVHSPAGGQGMNTGIQDAYNLAWKLAYVIKGFSLNSLLQSYDQERHPVAKDVMMTTAAMIRLANLHNSVLVSLRDFLIRHLAKIKFIKKNIVNKLAEFSVAYKKSSLNSGKAIKSFYPGCRMPDCVLNQETNYFLYDLLNTNHFHLLVFHANSSDQYKLVKLSEDYFHVLTLHFVDDFSAKFHEVYSFDRFALCLVRPDRYIAYLGDQINELQVFLETLFIKS